MSKRNTVVKSQETGASCQIGGSADLVYSAAHEAFAREYGASLEMSWRELIDECVKNQNKRAISYVVDGLAFIKAKTDIGHGGFEAYLRKVGLEPERVRECMAIADMLTNADPSDRKKLLTQPKTIQIGLARADSEVMGAMLASGKLDVRLTLAEYQAEIKRLQEQCHRLDTANSELKAKTQRLGLIGSQVVDHVTPLPVAHVRRDAVLLAAEAGLCIDGFAILMGKLNEVPVAPDGMDWARPVAVSMVSALESVRSALTEQINNVITAYALDVSIPEGADLQMAVPGPQEKALIDSALSDLMVKAQLKRAERDYAHYVEDREKNPSKGRMRKAPGAAK